MFVGEGPGRDEDLKAEPFVGRAGQLLTEIITKGMKLRREDVYIANVVKCRPPENRNPEPDEIAACEPFLLRQIEIVRPQVIVALGKFAAQTLLRTARADLAAARPVVRLSRASSLMPTLHPAYLLRNPGDKRLVWEDVKHGDARAGAARHEAQSHGGGAACRRLAGSRRPAIALAFGVGASVFHRRPPPLHGASDHVDLIVVDAGINPATADFIHESSPRPARTGRGADHRARHAGRLAGVGQGDRQGPPRRPAAGRRLRRAERCRRGVGRRVRDHGGEHRGNGAGHQHRRRASGRRRRARTSTATCAKKVENFTASLSKTIAQRARPQRRLGREGGAQERVDHRAARRSSSHVVDLVGAGPRRPPAADRRPCGDGANGTKTTLDVAAPRWSRKEMRLKQKLLNIIANPNIAYLLMMAGAARPLHRVHPPRRLLPGVAGGICLLLGLTALQVCRSTTAAWR